MSRELLQHPFMSRAALEHFTTPALIRAMLAFELALADSEEQHGILPAGTHPAMAHYLTPDIFDVGAIETDTALGGNAAIPFVQQAKAALPESLRQWCHHGATSQDVLDTALMQLSAQRLPVILNLVERSLDALAQLMRHHGDTLMIGRTLMQQALPTTFGVRAAQWALQLDEARLRLSDITIKGLPVQFGGPVGLHGGLPAGWP